SYYHAAAASDTFTLSLHDALPIFRLSNTTIQPQDNNPLKLSAGVEETFANLLLRDSDAHLPPVEAVREAFDDLQQHQQLVLKARSEEHTSELQSRENLVCRLLLEK